MGPTTPFRVTSISPQSGSSTGGTPVIISGADFSPDATVTIGGVAASATVMVSSGLINATTGEHLAPGPADVVVSSGGRTASLAAAFTFVAPSGANKAPVVTSIRSIGSRTNQPSGFGDIEETVRLVASVTDAETSAGSLTYEWSGPGSFSGSGPDIVWQLPATVSPSPLAVTASLKVTEPYTEGAITHRNVTTAGFTMQVHNSSKEILDQGEDFLTLFSQSDIPSDQVLHNFSTTCDGGQGRALEKMDVDRARREYRQDFSKFRITRLPPVTYNFAGKCVEFDGRLRKADACSQFSVHWEITYISGPRNGQREITDGTDWVTAVLENNQWRLCHSDFQGTSFVPTLGITRQVTW